MNELKPFSWEDLAPDRVTITLSAVRDAPEAERAAWVFGMLGHIASACSIAAAFRTKAFFSTASMPDDVRVGVLSLLSVAEVFERAARDVAVEIRRHGPDRSPEGGA